MFRTRAGILAFVMAIVPTVASQSVPKELLSRPARLELDKPTTEAKAGSTVTYTVILKDARDQAVATSRDLRLEIQTPSGQKTVVLPAGKSSVTFTWNAVNPGVGHMTVRSGKLRPAAGLVLVAPSRTAQLLTTHPQLMMKDQPQIAHLPAAHHPLGPAVAAGTHVATIPSGQPAPQPAAPVTAPAPPAPGHATKIQLYVEPLPIYGNAVDHVWKANVSVAALGNQNSLAPVSTDVPIHFNASSGHFSTPDIVLPAGHLSNFGNPVLLTADRSGTGTVEAVSSLGTSGPIQVEYLQPPPTQLRLSLGTPVLKGTGSSTASVQVCLLDESSAVTFSGHDVEVTLTAPGQLTSPTLTIPHDSSCSSLATWTAGAGTADIRAEAGGLQPDAKSITFPSFPWYFVWLAAIGGVVGALVFSSGELFSARWWSHTWRSLVLGAVLGAIFYLFTRFGAIALPKDSPVNLQNIPVVSGIGSLLLGFLGGLYGQKLWKPGQSKPKPAATP
jgi:hypothetical protein